MLAVDPVSDVSGKQGARSREMVVALAAGIVSRLRERVATPLVEPSTMARPFAIACQCEHCRSLAKFLSAPDEARWALKANETIRGHVESNARGADVDFSVERRGSPHSLVAQKNRNFDARAARRDANLAALRQLEAATA